MKKPRTRICMILMALVGFVEPERLAAEFIMPESSSVSAMPLEEVSILFMIRDNTTPLFGYSLDIDVIPQAGAVGSVTANAPLTNFFDVQNLITGGGAIRDPLFSTILDTGDGGVFISTNTDDLSTVLAVDGVNDVLVQAFFDVSPDAFGDFLITLGSGTALSDGLGFPVPFSFSTVAVQVVPEPGSAALVAIGLFMVGCLRRRNYRR